MKLYLIRHGRTKVDSLDFFGSRLSKNGKEEIFDLISAKILPKPDKIISSPFERAKDTAAAFAQHFGIPFEIRDFLKEWNLQTLNLPDKEYEIEEKKGWKDQAVKVKGEESLMDVEKRAVEGIMTLAKVNQFCDIIYMISHGTLIDLFCCTFSKREPKLKDIKRMKYLDHAIFELVDSKLVMIKDIVPKKT